MASREALRLAPSRLDDDSDFEVDEKLWSSSDGESEDDQSKQSNIRKVIDSLDKVSTKRKKRQRCEPSLNVSEYNLSSCADKDKIELNELVGSLQKDANYGNLKKRLESMERNAGTLNVPLHKPEADKIQRTIAYDETSKDIGKWQPIVKKNREAEQLSFPLNPYQEPAVTTKTLTASFKPRTPLEEEIAAVLKGSSHMMERKNKELTEVEEKALLAMNFEEARERRKELQRLRALQSYYEEKCRRAKKIKSKKYHRIKKKSQQRATEKRLEDLEKKDPEKGLEELEKLDRERAKERLSLKHRSTSKWAKNLLIRGQKNPEAKKALQEQLELSRRLTEKQKDLSESDVEEETNVKEDEDKEESNTFGQLVAEADNPWSIDNSQDPEVLDSERKNELSGFKRAEPVVNKEATMIDSDEENSEAETKDDDFEITLSKPKKSPKSTKKKRKKKSADKVDENRTPNKKQKQIKTKKDKSKSKKKIDKKNVEETANENSETENQNDEINRYDLIGDAPDPHKNIPVEAMKPKTSSKPTTVIVDPKKIFSCEEADLHGDDAGQLMTIQQAFANDDVIEEFVREKEEAVELSRGKDLDLTLPGWGEWGGPGVKASEKKKNKFVKKAEEKEPRKDKDLAHVIINEDVNKKFVKMQVKNVPHPYMNPDQFEKSIRNPVGRHWNTATTVKQLTQPRVRTLIGTIIEPIKPTKQFKRTKKDDDRYNNKKNKNRRSNIREGESLVIYN